MASDLGMSLPSRQALWPLLVQAETPHLDCWQTSYCPPQHLELPHRALSQRGLPFLQTSSQHKHAFNAQT